MYRKPRHGREEIPRKNIAAASPYPLSHTTGKRLCDTAILAGRTSTTTTGLHPRLRDAEPPSVADHCTPGNCFSCPLLLSATAIGDFLRSVADKPAERNLQKDQLSLDLSERLFAEAALARLLPPRHANARPRCEVFPAHGRRLT